MRPSGVLTISKRILLVSSLIVLLVAAALWFGAGRLGLPPGEAARTTSPEAASGFSGRAIDPPLPAPDFAMIDHHGRPFSLSGLRGRVVVLFFGYTNCPDVCPATLGQFKRVKILLGDDARDVQFLFVTVDPEYDSPDRLASYVGAVDTDFLGLWAAPEELQPVLSAYGVFVEKEPAPESPVGYWITHTASSYVIDRQGRLRLQEPFGIEAEKVAADLRRLVQESSPALVAAHPVAIEGAWARPGMEGGNSAVYFTLGNRGERELKLKGARADVAGDTQIHRTILEDHTGPDGSAQQVMRMVPAGEIELYPGEQALFKPGGLHVMLLGLKQALSEGDTVRLALFFEGLQPVELEVPVLPPTETGATMGMGDHGSAGK